MKVTARVGAGIVLACSSVSLLAAEVTMRRVSPHIIKEWENAGALHGHMVPMDFGFEDSYEDDKAPRFDSFAIATAKDLSLLPAPDAPFALVVSGRELDEKSAKAIAKFKHLIAFGVGNPRCAISDKAFIALSRCERLQTLVLTESRFTTEGLAPLCLLKNLSCLNLGESNITDEGMRIISKLPKIESLNLAYTKVTDSGLAELKNTCTIKRLSLSTLNISRKGFAACKDMDITCLSIRATALDDDCSDIISHFKHLEDLDVGFCEISDRFIAGLSCKAALRVLHADSTEITDQSASCLSAYPNIEVLDVSDTKLTSVGIESLCKLQKLKELELAGLPIGDESAKHLRQLGQLEGHLSITRWGLPALPLKKAQNRVS